MIDASERERAAHAFAENIVVAAGAGTGKTSLLVERVICQMIARDLDVSDFAAITFTEKAAAEMRKRLAESLAELTALARKRTSPAEAGDTRAASRAYGWLLDRLPAERIAELASKRLRDLERADISTIHGFCARLLRKYPLECRVDPGFTVDTGLGFEELQRDVWHAFLSGSDGPGGARAALWQRALEALDLAELEEIGRACASFELPDEAVVRGVSSGPGLLAPVAEDWLRKIDACTPDPPAKGPESWLEAARTPLVALRDAGLPDFASALEAARHQRTRGAEENLLDRDPPTSAANRLAEKLATRVQRFFQRLRTIDDALLSDALALLRPFAMAVRNEARVRGVLPFDALLALARELLRTHPGVRRELGGRYKALFLDEFQDTDPLQYEIVFFLAEDPTGVAAEDAFSTRLGPGKLFIVGDPKQAIYRFRRADIAAYKQAIAHVLERNGGTRLALVTNFRARPEVLEPIDRLFGPLLTAPDPASESAYSGYDGLVSGRTRVAEPRVEVWTVGGADSDRSADEGRRIEAEAIAVWAAAEIAAERLRPKDIALLFRALKDVHTYARALQDRGVPCLIGRSEDLESQPAGQQLLALLRALANPADAPAVLGVLRSPLGAVPDAELARWAGRFKGSEREACWSYPDVAPPAAELPHLARAFARLRELHTRARAIAPERLLTALVEETPLLAIHGSARDGERRSADLWLLVERLVEVAQALPGRDLADLVRGLEAEERRPTPGDAEATPDRVRLSSIHAAKGLEFPVVILADLARARGGGNEKSVEVELLRAPHERGRAELSLAISTRAAISASWIEHERAEAMHGTAEAGRLFYVACTRAEERLIFVHAPRKQKPPAEASIHQLAAWGYTAEGCVHDGPLAGAPDVLARSVAEPEPAVPSPPPTPSASPADAIDRALRAVARARESLHAPFASPSGLREDAEARALASDLEPVTAAPQPDSPDRTHARALGTALHDALERWDFRDGVALLERVGSAARRLAAAEGLEPGALEREARALAETLLATDLPAHLASVDVLGRELPILFRDPDGTVWSGSIDLLYRDTEGRLVVADYKTDRAPDEAARARYRAQLSTYARGVARVFPGETAPALELLWLRSGQRERLRLESDP